MGCFSVSCALSGLSIYSDDAVYIPLIPHKYQEENENGEIYLEKCDNIIASDGAFSIFQPKTLPIFGEYDTYGRLENIDENEISKISLDNFGEWFSGNFSQYGCFIQKDMWDWAVKKGRQEMSLYYAHHVGKTIENFSEVLGFVFEGIDKNIQRYNKVFHHISNPLYKFFTDGGYLQGSCYDLDSLDEICVKNNILLPDMNFLKSISSIEYSIKNDLENYFSKLETEEMFYFFTKRNCLERGHLRNFSSNMIDMYESVQDKDELARQIADLIHVSYVMYTCNKLFVPNFAGPQCGEYVSLKEMYSKAIEVCNNHIDDYNN